MSGGIVSGGITESAELSSTPVADDDQFWSTFNNNWIGIPITIGEVGRLYSVTHIEVKTGSSVSGGGDFICALMGEVSDPPTETNIGLRCLTEFEKAVASTTFKQPVTFSTILQGGKTWFVCFNHDTSGDNFRMKVETSKNNHFAETYSLSPAISRSLTWVANNITPYIKVYYREYS